MRQKEKKLLASIMNIIEQAKDIENKNPKSTLNEKIIGFHLESAIHHLERSKFYVYEDSNLKDKSKK